MEIFWYITLPLIRPVLVAALMLRSLDNLKEFDMLYTITQGGPGTEWNKVAAMPDTRQKLQNAGFETMSSSPEQFAELIKAEIPRWAKVIKEANVSAD